MKATELLDKIEEKTSVTQIIMDIRKGMKGKFDKGTSKTNFVAKGGAEFEFEYEDGIKYKITVDEV